jgi:putative ABC transport system substrate-binding protein
VRLSRLFRSLLVLLITPVCVQGQPVGATRRVGVIDDDMAKVETFRAELAKLGWSDKSIIIDSRIGRDEDYQAFATELVRGKVDVIFAPTTRAVQAAKAATKTIPIVFALAADPIRSGFAASLSAPGGNITGLTPINAELSAKRLELLKTVLPKIRRVGVLADPALPYTAASIRELENAGRALQLELHVVHWRNMDELELAFGSMRKARAEAFIAVPTPANWPFQNKMSELALAQRLPGISPAPEFAQSGVLMAYGQSLLEQYRGAAIYVDKILKGAKPAELPIGQPTKLDFVINLKTAAALGLRIPDSVLVRADYVIR